MKQIYCLIGIWLCTFSAIAQSETTDSIKTQELNEVVVTAPENQTIGNKTSFYPTKELKKATNNGVQLLSGLQIPGYISDILLPHGAEYHLSEM